MDKSKALAMPGVVDVVVIPRFEEAYGSIGGVGIATVSSGVLGGASGDANDDGSIGGVGAAKKRRALIVRSSSIASDVAPTSPSPGKCGQRAETLPEMPNEGEEQWTSRKRLAKKTS